MQLKSHQEIRSDGVYDTRNKINNLTGKEWLFSTRSIKSKKYDFYFNYSDLIKLKHLDFMPIELISEIIKTFSKPGSLIVDPFCNFGFSGYATAIAGELREYLGFSFFKNHNININVKSDNLLILFNEDSIVNFISLLKEKEISIVFTELIFSSLDPKVRTQEYEIFEKKITSFMNFQQANNLNIKFMIISIQNTKTGIKTIGHNHFPSQYYYNSKKINDLITSFKYNLKAELIWKIHDDVIVEVKQHILAEPNFNDNLVNLLNDKRILIFKKD